MQYLYKKVSAVSNLYIYLKNWHIGHVVTMSVSGYRG